MPRGGVSPPSSNESPLPPFVLATLRDPEAEWEDQRDALKALTAAAKSDAVARPNSQARHEFLRQLRDVGQPLATCIAAPRSTLVREASQCIIQCVEVFGPLFVDTVGNTLARPILDKTGVSIAVIRESAFEAGKALFEHGVTGFSPDIVNMLCEYVQNSKLSSLKRAAAAQFLGMVLVEDCLAGLEPIMGSIQRAIVRGCQDSDERVRALSRENWRKLEILDRSSARQLLNEMPANTTALIAREKGGSPWSEKSAGGRFEQRKSPGSPGRTFKFAPQRYPPTAKRLHPQRVTSESVVESADISPSTAIRRAVTSHTTTTSSLPTSRVGRTQRTAVRLPRPQVRAVDSGSNRPGLPPRPISIPKVRDGMPQAGSVLNRQFGRPVSRPIRRPARRSMAMNPKNTLQGSPPGGVTDHREKVRQSVPAALARAIIIEEQASSIASPGSSSSAQSEAKKDGQDTEFFTPSPISRADIKAGRLPVSPQLEESTHSGAEKPHSTPRLQTQGIPRTLSGDSFVTAHEERKSLSFRETAMEIASRMYRSLQGSSESTDEARTLSPKRDPMEVDTEQPSSQGEESDFVSLSSVGSGDRGIQEPSPKAVNSPANPRKARLSFILNMNASPPQFTVPQPQVVTASVTQGFVGSKMEAVNVPWNDPTNAKQQPTAPLQPSADVSATSKYPNDHIESMSDEIELLMSMQSLTEEVEKPASFRTLIPTTTPVVAKSPEPVSTSICTTEGESSREGESSVGNVTVEDVIVYSSPDKPKEAGNGPEGNLVLTGKIANEKENARPASAISDATAVLKKDPDQDAEKDPKQISKLETEEVNKAPKMEERKPLRPAKEMASIAPSNAPRPKSMPSPTQPAEPSKGEGVPAKRPHNATALPPRWKTNKASIARTTARRSMMFDVAIRSQDSDPPKKREARKGDVTRRLPQRVPYSSGGVAKKVGRPPYMAPALMSGKPRPPMPGARRSLMPGIKMQPPPSAPHAPRVRRSLMPGAKIQPAPGASDAKATSRPPSVCKARPASTRPPPQNGKKVEKSKSATMKKTGAANNNKGMSGASRRVAEWLKQAKRIKNGAWEERCKALKGFGEACQKLDGERISMGLADECIGVLGEYIRQGHHRVISEALDGLFFLLLCSEGSSHMLQRALEKREDVMRRTLGLLITGSESARLAAGRVMHSFEVQFSPEVMVGLIMRAMNQGGGGGVADVRVAKMGCVQLGKAFERAAISGEGFVWKTGLLESVLKTLEGLCGHRRVGVRRAGDGVVEQVRESLPERAFELACEKYGVKFGEGK
ncbi:unnamed protein product [Chondrus crispus]|uniref:CLASP N-terminal domain-containing protein n=1 Tax=Chondrus crispus TaxID=2769 RepID=R7QH66_CHOCR|nr:unnamed protein product [Chondrus crispus]CDF36811.1 unnamed protein product [Chondrus crispus]|eukprot:XP_005716630.1 unnamed protein product [Chondrus crispus]